MPRDQAERRRFARPHRSAATHARRVCWLTQNWCALPNTLALKPARATPRYLYSAAVADACREDGPEGGWRSPTKASVYVYECDPKPRRHRAAAASGRELSVELAKLQACAWCVGLEASPPQFC
eukprot:COSAG06_NODE_235_length_19514_cov_33.329333_1_plen_123_part_10